MPSTTDALQQALIKLKAVLLSHASGRIIRIAYSGGLDSRFLAFFAASCGLQVELLHASGGQISVRESEDALARAREIGLTVRVVPVRLPSPQVLAEAGRQRCYVCKHALFSELKKQAAEALCDGGNASDALAFRPGERAVRELGVHSPLAEAGLTKPMIREAASRLGLPDPGQAARPCLMTRFDYGDAPDERRLKLTAQAEDFLSGLQELKRGFRLRWLGRQPLLHVSAANALSSDDLEAIRGRLVEYLPELKDVRTQVLESLSGWFDRRRKPVTAGS